MMARLGQLIEGKYQLYDSSMGASDAHGVRKPTLEPLVGKDCLKSSRPNQNDYLQRIT